MADETTGTTTADVDAFVERWAKTQGSGRANGQLFVRELAALVLGLVRAEGGVFVA